ncbi:MAG: nucleotide sugar dehydrogenase [Gemmataceae bacterium]
MDTICIVGGCGHVGLPLGIAFTLAGAKVTLLDIDEQRLEAVRSGHMPFLEQGAEEALPAALKTGRLQVSNELRHVAEHDNVIVTIGTPVDEFLDPSIRSFDRSLDAVLKHMRDGQLLILRSTVFPGVSDRLARRAHASKRRIDVAHCPERIAQGFALDELGRLPQIIGGTTPRATARAARLFDLLGVRLLTLPALEAELAKLFANSYRYISFAIANQFYLIAEKFGCDFYRIHEAITLDYPRMANFPKAGFAGGPCLLKDTMQLGAFNHNHFILGQAAMMINEGLPQALVDQVKRQYDLSAMKAAILGMAFKGNNDDPRASLSYKLRKVLLLECQDVICTDPYIQEPDFVSLEEALNQGDIFFLGACHEEYRHLRISKPLVDIFHFMPAAQASSRLAA